MTIDAPFRLLERKKEIIHLGFLTITSGEHRWMIVSALVDKLDSRLDDLAGPSNHDKPPNLEVAVSSAELDPAPVFLIRDAATDAGVHSPEQVNTQPGFQPDVISTGLVSLSTAHSLLGLFHLHYGRWVRFPEDIPTDRLLVQVRRSPLLLCSIFLISVRHTTQILADRLAPKLFEESKRLITASLLEVPQTIEFFQAVLILSLWSTTIGQVPLSIDSWLLTGYAIQQALASSHFMEAVHPGTPQSTDNSRLDALCLWNHICVAHLQYCVGTRRRSLLNQAQVDRCVSFVKSNEVSNYEARMGAEVQLYWIIYNKCGHAPIDLAGTKLALQTWQQDWVVLFHEPRSQFLQMGFHFAHLLAHCQSLKSPKSVMHSSVLKEMIKHSRIIINLAIDTTDDRTRHLTDHIYHILSFSALTLCRIVHTYETKLRAANYEINELDNLVFKLINWFKTIGLPCHAAHILGDIVYAQFQKLRPDFQPTTPIVSGAISEQIGVAYTAEDLPLAPDLSFLYPNFIGSEMFDADGGLESWPEWAQIAKMDHLAPEIISNIISHLLPEEYFLSGKYYDESQPLPRAVSYLAALNRHWHPFIEAVTFRELKLNSESLFYAIENGILNPRRLSYVRRIDYSFPSNDDPALPLPVENPEVDSGFVPLLKLLAQIPLEEEPLLDLAIRIPWKPFQAPGFLSQLKDHVQDNFANIQSKLAQSLAGLPSSIDNFSLDFSSARTSPKEEPMYAAPNEDLLSRELHRFSQRVGLKDFSYQGSIESTIFWPSESDTAEDPYWPSLKSFVLEPHDVSPSGKRLVVHKPYRSANNAMDWRRMYPDDEVMNEFYLAAARCAARMPKVEYLSVDLEDSWFTTMGFCTQFPEEPCLTFSGGGGPKIYEETVEEWRKTAGVLNVEFLMEAEEELD
ncbi:hypothetical protein FBEOM_8594 [Fusarium beomiforme]|uniref:Transcription factor domain-containing protein n=1 Tax=Fusarium beomiforme TaxID=44412 RepID=A0A9P5DUB3_9HYPO|nr:hypothetical protein FBEOM_8594 [Fusarium beomiforme]